MAHLWKIYALPRMIYGLEVFSLSTDDIMQLEQLQRKVIRQIQSFPINTTLTAVYGLLGIRPIEQELNIRKLVLLGNVFLNKGSLEYEIARRQQLAVKSYESKSWFSVCNRLLHKNKLPNIYNVCKNIESMKKWKQLVNTAIDTYVLSQWMNTPKK